MSFIPAGVAAKASRSLLHLQKASPQVLFVGGVVGVVGSVVLACRATLKLEELLDEAAQTREVIQNTKPDEKFSESDIKKAVVLHKAKTAGRITKLYAPAIVVGAISIGALTGSHVILSKRNAGLTAAYKTIDKAFDEYRKRVEKELGPDKAREILRNVEGCEIETEDGKKETVNLAKPGISKYARFYDEHASSWSRHADTNLMFLKAQQNWANNRLQARGHLFLNEVWDMLGLDHTSAGAVVGWIYDHEDGDGFIDFGIFNPDSYEALQFLNGENNSVLIEPNVQGVIYDLIER